MEQAKSSLAGIIPVPETELKVPMQETGNEGFGFVLPSIAIPGIELQPYITMQRAITAFSFPFVVVYKPRKEARPEDLPTDVPINLGVYLNSVLMYSELLGLSLRSIPSGMEHESVNDLTFTGVVNADLTNPIYLDRSSELTISGSGYMPSYIQEPEVPEHAREAELQLFVNQIETGRQFLVKQPGNGSFRYEDQPLKA